MSNILVQSILMQLPQSDLTMIAILQASIVCRLGSGASGETRYESPCEKLNRIFIKGLLGLI